MAEGVLDEPELGGLEAAGAVEPVAEAVEGDRRHRLQDVHLGDERLEDGQDALSVASAAARRPSPGTLQQVGLVEDLLEPELVDLVDDDEQRLVVLRPVRRRRLEVQELVEAQIGAVGPDQGFLPSSGSGYHSLERRSD